MAHVGMLLLTYVALVCQASYGDLITVRGVSPDFLLLVVFVAAFWLRGAPAVFWCALAGLLSDCFATTQLGMHMLFASLLVSLLQTFVGADWRGSKITQLILGTALLGAILIASNVAHLLLARQPVVLPALVPPLVATAACTAALGLALRMMGAFVGQFVPAGSPEPRIQAAPRWNALNR